MLSACKARTEIILGVLTDLKAPTTLDEVQLDVAREGVPLLSQQWLLPGIPGQPFILPGSYGLFDPDGNDAPVAITLTGFRAGVQIVPRSAAVSLVPGQTLFLRMALVASCETVSNCAADETCIEGTCRPQLVDTRTLPTYVSGMESQLACASGPAYIDTSTGAPLVPVGNCAAGQTCQEGTCYTSP
jgi:hypothetical protein